MEHLCNGIIPQKNAEKPKKRLSARNRLERAIRASLEGFEIDQNGQKKCLSLDSIPSLVVSQRQ